MGNDEQCEIKGIGSIKLQLYDGTFKILSFVKYVLGLRRNLITLGTFAGFRCR